MTVITTRKPFTMEGSGKGNGPCSTAGDSEQDEVMRSKDFESCLTDRIEDAVGSFTENIWIFQPAIELTRAQQLTYRTSV
jgi:hypothetical protein